MIFSQTLPSHYLSSFTQLRKSITVEEFPFITARQENLKWSEHQLREQIMALGHWEYYFPFSHGLTTEIYATFNDSTKLFHRYRSKLISETLVDVMGNSIHNASILDLGAHCGVMSLDMAFRGAKQVHGVEYRARNVAQANFLKSYYELANVDFEQADAMDLPDTPYDVVMCLGLLYHVVSPVELIEYCYRNAGQLAVIDTNCSQTGDSRYQVVTNKNITSHIEGTRTIELQPSYQAVIDTMLAVGFKHIIEVVGVPTQTIPLYSDRTRCCFIGVK